MLHASDFDTLIKFLSYLILSYLMLSYLTNRLKVTNNVYVLSIPFNEV